VSSMNKKREVEKQTGGIGRESVHSKKNQLGSKDQKKYYRIHHHESCPLGGGKRQKNIPQGIKEHGGLNIV